MEKIDEEKGTFSCFFRRPQCYGEVAEKKENELYDWQQEETYFDIVHLLPTEARHRHSARLLCVRRI